MKTSSSAIVGLILGIVGFFVPICAIPALILGIIALKDIGRRPGELEGRGIAIAAVVLGGVGLILLIVVLIYWGVLYNALFGGGGFDRFKKSKQTKPSLKPGVYQQIHNPSDWLKLESIDSRLRAMA